MTTRAGLLLTLLIFAGLAAISGLVTTPFWMPFSYYSARSSSMMPNIGVGDLVSSDSPKFVCRAHGLAPGKVVFERFQGVMYIRRLVAGPGDTVEMRDGRLIVDGRAVATTPVGPLFYGGMVYREILADGARYEIQHTQPGGPGDNSPPVKLGPGEWYGLGDNRDNADDFRFQGPIRTDAICGVAQRILYSSDSRRRGQKL